MPRILRRALRNLFRKPFRTGLVVLFVSLAVGLFAIMATVNRLAALRFAELEGNLESRFEIRPKGSLGLGGRRSRPLPFDVVEQIQAIAPDVQIAPYLIRRKFQDASTLFFVGHRPGTPMLAVGEPEPMDSRLISGRTFRPDEGNGQITVLGLELAKRLGLDPRSSEELGLVPLLGAEWKVVGIFDSGNGFSNLQAFFPLNAMAKTVRAGGYAKLVVRAPNAARAWDVAEKLRGKLGEQADVVTNRDAVRFVQAMLGGVAAASQTGAVLFFAAAVLVVFGAMVLHFRDQVREVGIEKALGASNPMIAGRLVLESLILSLAAGAGGLLLSTVGLSIYRRSWTSIKFHLVESPLSLLSVGIIIGACLLLGALGGLYPIVRCRRLNPVEILRDE
ncbi:MAG: ABC transporter permease [Nitrospinota bacterium]